MASKLVVDIHHDFTGGSIAASATLDLPPGRPLVLFGPSGSGKTTILRSIAGLAHPGDGSIRFGDSVWFDSASGTYVSPQKRRVGFLSQSYDLFPHLTVRQNVAYGARDDARVDDLLERLHISPLADRRPAVLSGGEKQRVALARTLASEPRILLLDEPLSALDAPTRAQLRQTLRSILQESSIPAIIVTHDRNEALALGDEIAVVIDGRIAQSGDVQHVFNHPASVEVARATGVETVVPVEIIEADDSIVIARHGKARIESSAVGSRLSGREAFALIHAHEVTIENQRKEGISARNQLTGTIRSIIPEDPLVRIRIDCGFELTALVTRRSSEEMSLREGATVVATIKASAVQLVPRH